MTFLISAAALSIALGTAMAQPTGNPKGTVAPPSEGNAAKSPASGNRARQTEAPPQQGSATNPDSRAARSGNLHTPGVGTAGGLTGRHPGTGSTNGPTQTDQAPPVKK
ncbi:hypothetical protein [Variovorax sp. KK3]|uniref:hypothetical protein n=1 Tax=Variovorax sp. KK3 TaxID=1855728 RepID=UPI00118058C1|nr:hypothetical protein [Variovorax sp. KK3]